MTTNTLTAESVSNLLGASDIANSVRLKLAMLAGSLPTLQSNTFALDGAALLTQDLCDQLTTVCNTIRATIEADGPAGSRPT